MFLGHLQQCSEAIKKAQVLKQKMGKRMGSSGSGPSRGSGGAQGGGVPPLATFRSGSDLSEGLPLPPRAPLTARSFGERTPLNMGPLKPLRGASENGSRSVLG